MELQQFWSSCIRVFRITKKPSQQEFRDLVKITGLGLLAIGVIGFIVQAVNILLT